MRVDAKTDWRVFQMVLDDLAVDVVVLAGLRRRMNSSLLC